MTFTEAALEVLEREGRTMHAREIAEKAVEWNLLSHVGKTPVQTMSARISAVVAKGKGPFVRVRPGVFALEKWGGKAPGPSKSKPEPKSERNPEPKPERKPERKPEPKPEPRAKPKSEPTPERKSEPRPEPERAEKTEPRSRQETNGEDNGQSSRDSQEEREGGRKRKRRRKKKRPEEDAPPQSQAQDRRADQPQDRRADQAQDRRPDQVQERRGEQSRDGRRDSVQSPKVMPSAEAGVCDNVETLLHASTRPVQAGALAESIMPGKKSGSRLLDAILTADGAEREHKGLRPRFVEHRSGWALAEREVSSEIVSLEGQVHDAVDRLAAIAGRQVLRRLRSLSMNTLVRVAVLYLRHSGFGSMTPIDRGESNDFHLSAQDRRRGGRFNTGVIVRRDSPDRPLGDRIVSELRGSLHKYDSMRGMIITTGMFTDQARAEAVVPNLPPVALVDGEVLTGELVRLGIGVRERRVSLPTFDETFFTDMGV